MLHGYSKTLIKSRIRHCISVMTAPTKPVNIIALTQGASIDIFLRVAEKIKGSDFPLGEVGALVSFAQHYKSSNIVKEHEGDNIRFIKEWEIVHKALSEPYDKAELAIAESKLSPAAVWNAIIADRRLIYGRKSKYTQDYRVHFTDEQLWSIAYHFIKAYEDLLERIKPDVIIGFTPVTFGEVLGLEIAASRDIPTLQLHSSRVKNYFALHDVVSGTSRHFYDLMERKNFRTETVSIANDIIDETAKKGLVYEGANKSIASGRPLNILAAIKTFPAAAVREVQKFCDPVLRRDHHDPGYIIPWAYTKLLQPIKERWIKIRLSSHKRVVKRENIEGLGDYCFFPLQSEPEVSLQVLGRPYHKNQIELLRNLAASLPAGMKLLVKEHPRSMGLRPYCYYKALFEIPNLYVADVHAPSIPMVNASRFVGIISGTIGFEAVMMGKPVLILGHPKYEAIPGKVTRKCLNLFEMPNDIRTLLDEYEYSRENIVTFISALIEGSVDIDLYSNLLKKPGRHSFQDGLVSEDEDLDKLCNYMIKRIEGVLSK